MDFGYLESFLGGDRAIIEEVLGLFRKQAVAWAPRLTPEAADWREVTHSLKGSALGLGASRLAELCGQAEAGRPDLLPDVSRELAEVLTAIDAYQAEAHKNPVIPRSAAG
jgi:HPt (histidine-containing phosphotransfer) domain-containing protein